jgi:hypothetical protein
MASMEQVSFVAQVPDRGVDAKPEARPGVPMLVAPPKPVDGAHWREPDRQPPSSVVTKRIELAHLTPVFGTAQPPRGLSGALRRVAYTIPEHRPRHWMLLMLADRVDVLEHGAGAATWVALAAPAILAAAAGVGAALSRPRRRRSLRRLLRAAAW